MRRSAECPVCGRPATPNEANHPFCSERCKMVDLGRWLDEEYRVAAYDQHTPPEEREGGSEQR